MFLFIAIYIAIAIAVAGCVMWLYSYLRDSSEANIGVRVGVHSGRVESAIVGLARWRYDVWSSDVQLVEHVVSASLPGSVQLIGDIG